MVARLFAAIVRVRKPLVVAEVALAAVYIAVDVPRGGEVGRALFPWTLGIFVLAAALAWLAAARCRPAALVTRAKPPVFDAPDGPLPVLAFTALAPMVTEKVSTTVDRVAKQIDPWWLDILTSTLWVLALAVVARAVWSGFGVRLRRDGVVDRRLVKSLFVPWEEFASEIPHSRKALTTVNIDNRFLARAIQEYVSHPEHRPAIGTEAELRRLHAAAAG